MENLVEEDLFTLDESESLSEVARNKMKMLWVILIMMIMTQVMYMNIATFLPPYRLEHHPSLTDTHIGIILS